MSRPTTARADARPETKAWFYYQTVDRIMANGADEETAERLASAKIVASKKGTLAAECGGTASALTKRECEWLGRVPGPGNN